MSTEKTIGLTVAVILVLFLIFGFTVPVKDFSYNENVPYEVTETYQVQEPYTATETYTEKEPYTDIEYYTNYVTVNVPYTVTYPCGGWQPPRPPGPIPPGPRPPIPPPQPPQMCTRTEYHPKVQAVQGSKEVTKYRDVTKQREVIKIRTVDKTRQVIKIRTETRWKKVPLFY